MCLEIITTLLLGLTLLAVIWYAWETRRLRRESVKQTELNLRPCIVIYNTRWAENHFENIGHGPAFDISVEPAITDTFKVIFEPYDIIRAGQVVELRFELESCTPKGEKILKDIEEDRKLLPGPVFPFDLKSGDYIVTINYKNIENTPYFTQLLVKVKENRIEVLKTDKIK